MRVYRAQNGREMIVYGAEDGDWWKTVRIPRPPDPWRWPRRLLYLSLILAAAWFTLRVLIPVAILSAVLALHTAAGKAGQKQRRE